MNEKETQFYTSFTAAKKLLVTTTTIIKWINLGHIKTCRTLGGHRRIPAEEINRIWDKMNNDFTD